MANQSTFMSTAVTLTLVAACLHPSAKKCSSIWSHTQHYTHILKVFKYFLCENREVISCRQFGRSQVLTEYAAEILLNPQKLTFSSRPAS